MARSKSKATRGHGDTGTRGPDTEQPAAPVTGDATADEPGQGAELATARDQAPESPVDTTTVTTGEADSAATPDAADPAPEPAPPAKGEAQDAGDVAPAQPSIDSVLAGLEPECPGAVITRPEVHLTGEQAMLQLRVYQTLSKQGLTLRSQGDVYGWLLGQMLKALEYGSRD